MYAWMTKHSKESLIFSFVLPVLFQLFWWLSTRLFGQECDFFNRGGMGWAFLCGLYYGIVFGTILFCLCYITLNFSTRSNKKFIAGFFVIALSFLVYSTVEDDQTLLDKVIFALGYRIYLADPNKKVPKDEPIPAGYQALLPPNTRLEAETLSGKITITSGKGLLRTLGWDHTTHAIELVPVAGDSKKMLDYPVKTYPGFDLNKRGEILLCSYSEEFIDLPGEAQALTIIYRPNDKYFPTVYTHDGLVVGGGTYGQTNDFGVAVWQILINGKKPKQLLGSDDSKIHLIRLKQ